MEHDEPITSQDLKALLALQKICSGEECFLNVIDGDRLVKNGFAEIYGKGQFVLTARGLEILKTIKIDTA